MHQTSNLGVPGSSSARDVLFVFLCSSAHSTSYISNRPVLVLVCQGDVAQMVELVLGMHEAQGSIPCFSIFFFVVCPSPMTIWQNESYFFVANDNLAKRQLGNMNPCGQSPADFKSASLTTRTSCLLHCASLNLFTNQNEGAGKNRTSRPAHEAGIIPPRPLTRLCQTASRRLEYMAHSRRKRRGKRSWDH